MRVLIPNRLDVVAAFVAVVAVFPISEAWRLSQQRHVPENAPLPSAAAKPQTCDDAAVKMDRFNTDLSIVLLTPEYAGSIGGLADIEEISKERDVNLDKVKEFLRMSRQDPRAIDVHHLAEVHAEASLMLSDLAARIRRECKAAVRAAL